MFFGGITVFVLPHLRYYESIPKIVKISLIERSGGPTLSRKKLFTSNEQLQDWIQQLS